ncbi:MAG: deoxyribodipyrimidine photo-lyase [Pseudomonadota bacterium]
MPDSIHAPTLLWLRRDLRLADHAGWNAALDGSGPVIPVFIRDPLFDQMTGTAPAWRMGEALATIARALESRGSRLILRQGEALETLQALVAETGARRVIWSRAYDNRQIARDTELKAALKADGVEAVSVNTTLLFEPWTVETKTGGFYKVYTPFWNAVRGRDVAEPLPTPGDLAAPEVWPVSDTLSDWALGRGMQRGEAVIRQHAVIGEDAARNRLGNFIVAAIDRYQTDRDLMGVSGTSRLSENLAYGEISPRQVWHAGRQALAERGAPAGAETFLKEIVWREFAYHLLYHCPDLEVQNFKPEWDHFPWQADNPGAERWRRGMTGIEIIDAAMRELYVTGTMHNRCRMLVGSLLTKHLMTDWRIGEAWFRDCLIDWDVASNAMGWQWISGAGPDAAPYFRVFNPDTQAEKFDPTRLYRDRWIAEGKSNAHADALSFFDAVPQSWGLSPTQTYPEPVVSLSAGRERALAAYSNRDAA